MAEYPRMLYRAGGVEAMHGGMFTTCIVHSGDEKAAALADGWALSTADAVEAAAEPVADSQTRDELLKVAADRGIKVDRRWSDRKLAELVA